MRLSSKPDIDRLLARRDTDGLIRALGYRQDPLVYEAASKALVEMGALAIPSLVLSLSEPELRDGIVRTLVDIGPLAVGPLVQALKTTTAAGVRMAAASALSGMGMLAVDPLIATLRHRSESVRQAAGTALAGIGSFAVEPLNRMLVAGAEPSYVRRAVAVTLGQIGGPRAVSALTAALRDEHFDEVRSAILEALERTGIQSADSRPPGLVRPAKPPREDSLVWPGSTAATPAPPWADPDTPPVREAVGSQFRWTRFRAALPELKPVAANVIQRLRQAYPVHREYSTADAVISDVEVEYTNYSRLRDAEYASVSVKLVFDNYVDRDGQAAPATRQLEVIAVFGGAKYIVFYNTGFVEVW